MKIKQTLEMCVNETNRSVDQLIDIFESCESSVFLYNNDCELFGFRTTDKPIIRYIIDISEFDGRINIDLVDVLEINF